MWARGQGRGGFPWSIVRMVPPTQRFILQTTNTGSQKKEV